MDVNLIKRLAIASGIGLVGGVAIGELVGYIQRKIKEKSPSKKAIEDELSRISRMEKEQLLNAKKRDRMENSRIYSDMRPHVEAKFEKPDISELVDYTKYYETVEKVDGVVLSVNGMEVDENFDPSDIPVGTPSAFEIISEEEFVHASGNDDGYASVTGTWLPNTHVLVGWNDEEEPKDVKTNIGEEALLAFDDPDVKAVYVRNTTKKVLYEILRGYDFDEVQEPDIYTGSEDDSE